MSPSSKPTCWIFGCEDCHSVLTVPVMLTSFRSTSCTSAIGITCPGAARNSSYTPTTALITPAPSTTRSANRRLIAARDQPANSSANRIDCWFTAANSSCESISRGSGRSGSHHGSTLAARSRNPQSRSALPCATTIRHSDSRSDSCPLSYRSRVRSITHSRAAIRSSASSVWPNNRPSAVVRSFA